MGGHEAGPCCTHRVCELLSVAAESFPRLSEPGDHQQIMTLVHACSLACYSRSLLHAAAGLCHRSL
eukprot:m.246290 g.246290  ORF g.246290 m.246290 type:complete len:66 (+) comp14974_c0_seq1:178-375(+)